MVGNVFQLNPPSVKVEITDYAKVMLQYETERINLNNAADIITADQTAIMSKAMTDVAALSKKHVEIIERRVALDNLILECIMGLSKMNVSKP